MKAILNPAVQWKNNFNNIFPVTVTTQIQVNQQMDLGKKAEGRNRVEILTVNLRRHDFLVFNVMAKESLKHNLP